MPHQKIERTNNPEYDQAYTSPVSRNENISIYFKQTWPTLDGIRLFANSALRSQTRRGKKNGKSAILTDSSAKIHWKLKKKDSPKKRKLQKKSDKRGKKNWIQSQPGMFLVLRLEIL